MSVQPKKSLGQHFLVDENILGVIGRLAELAPDDVVLEIGPGLGVLTRYLAARVARVHAVELDRSLEPRLRDLPENVTVEFGDALRLDLAAAGPMRPSSSRTSRTTSRRRSSSRASTASPGIGLWCVMLQREVADRLFAAPSTKAYGAVSVLVQLAAERTGFHPVSRSVFRPRPNVDSALVAFRRTALPREFARVKEVVAAAFAHRRKTLPNSLALAGFAARSAPRTLSRRSAVRPRPAQRRSPRRVRRAGGGAAMSAPPPPPRSTSRSSSARRGGDGKHEVLTVSSASASSTGSSWSRRRRSRSTASRTTRSSAPLSRRSRAPPASSRAGAPGSRRRSPSPPGSAAAAPTQPPRSGSRTRRSPSRCRPRSCTRWRPTLGADVPFFLSDGPQLGSGDGSELERLDLPQDFWVVLLHPHGAVKPSTGSVYAAFDDRRGADGWEERRRTLREALAASSAPATSRRCRRTTSSRRRSPASCSRGRLPRRRQRGRPGALRALPSPRRGTGRGARVARLGRAWTVAPAWYG